MPIVIKITFVVNLKLTQECIIPLILHAATQTFAYWRHLSEPYRLDCADLRKPLLALAAGRSCLVL